MEKIIGINPVIEALRANKKIEKIEIFNSIKKNTIKDILELASKRNIKIFYVNKRDNNSQGVCAYVSDYGLYKTLEEFLEKELQKDKSVIVILDQVQDPGNFGAIIRSCECFGVKGIIIQDRNNVRVTETVIKASAGAIEHTDIVLVTNISDAITKLKKYGYFVYGTQMQAPYSYNKINYNEKTAIVLGNEGKGIRKKY